MRKSKPQIKLELLGLEFTKTAMHNLYKGCEKRFNYSNNICMCSDCIDVRRDIACSAHVTVDFIHIHDRPGEMYVKDETPATLSDAFIRRAITYSDGVLIENEVYIKEKLMKIMILNLVYSQFNMVRYGQFEPTFEIKTFIENYEILNNTIEIVDRWYGDYITWKEDDSTHPNLKSNDFVLIEAVKFCNAM